MVQAVGTGGNNMRTSYSSTWGALTIMDHKPVLLSHLSHLFDIEILSGYHTSMHLSKPDLSATLISLQAARGREREVKALEDSVSPELSFIGSHESARADRHPSSTCRLKLDIQPQPDSGYGRATPTVFTIIRSIDATKADPSNDLLNTEWPATMDSTHSSSASLMKLRLITVTSRTYTHSQKPPVIYTTTPHTNLHEQHTTHHTGRYMSQPATL
jgi:hypothetical protein